jgi:hypothetical protein
MRWTVQRQGVDMFGFFDNPHRVLKLSHLLLVGGLFMLIAGIMLAYGLDAYLNLPQLVCAHALTILGPTAIKLGYVMRLLSLNRLRLEGLVAGNGATA